MTPLTSLRDRAHRRSNHIDVVPPRSWHCRGPADSYQTGDDVLECGMCSGPLPKGRSKYCSNECRSRRHQSQYAPPGGYLPLSTGTTGALSEMLAAIDLTLRGFQVFRAISPHAACDLVAINGSQILRVEVRTALTRLDGSLADLVAAVLPQQKRIEYYLPDRTPFKAFA